MFQELSFHGTFAPWNFRSSGANVPRTFVPCPPFAPLIEASRFRKCLTQTQTTFVPFLTRRHTQQTYRALSDAVKNAFFMPMPQGLCVYTKRPSKYNVQFILYNSMIPMEIENNFTSFKDYFKK